MFSGVISLDRAGWPIPRPSRSQMAAPFAVFGAADAEGLLASDAALLYERRRFISAQNSDIEVPGRCPRSGAWVSFWGRLDNRPDLARAIGWAGAGDDTTDAQLVAAAWDYFGRDLPARLIGDFALAVLDPERRQVFLARDPMGVKPLFYRYDSGLFAFASTAAALKLEGLPLTPDRGWIARYLWWGLSKHVEGTAYTQIYKLPGGHSLFLDGDAPPRVERWQQPWRDDAPFATRRDPAHVEAYRAQLEESVHCRLPSLHPVGVETSGGLDSSAVLALAVRRLGVSGTRLRTYGLALADREPELALATSLAYGIEDNFIATGYRVREDEKARILAAVGYPIEVGIAESYVAFYRDAAMQGVRTLLSGFGGDEVVTNPAFQALFEMRRAHAYGALLEMMRGNALTRPLRLAKQILRPLRPKPYNASYLSAWRRRWPSCPLADSVIEQFGIEQVYFDSARYDGPYPRVNDFILQHHLAGPDFTARLENCTLAAAAWGIEYRWPLWDVRLVQLYLSTPTIEKFGPKGLGRYLHRRAIQGLVPDKITFNPTKDTGARVRDPLDPAELARWGRSVRERIPADIASLLDADKLDRQIARLGEAPDLELRVTFKTTFSALERLTRWLDGSSA